MSETILVVDDEESVRRTFAEWLSALGPTVTVISVGDAESALRVASERPVDLAILDWNLGSGSDGLQLLEDLVEFQPELTAILVTGFAHQATPLQALRMGVRDYLDKNTDLTRESFLAAVQRQLARLRPLKRQRELQRSLAAFRTAVEQIVPYLQGAAVWQDPVPVPQAARDLLRLALRITAATDGVLLVHVRPSSGVAAEERLTLYPVEGDPTTITEVAFRHTLAATALSQQEPLVLTEAPSTPPDAFCLLPPEKQRRNLLIAPLVIDTETAGALELFDKATGTFSQEDVAVVRATAELGADLLRRSRAERHSQRLLIDALAAALQATQQVQDLIPDDRPRLKSWNTSKKGWNKPRLRRKIRPLWSSCWKKSAPWLVITAPRPWNTAFT
ncbi:MAG: response regulator [Gemmataceae bacterium]|nr:response regulator [Gemmataceae bacterium]